MSLIRNILIAYRCLQYLICGRKEKGLISNYTQCTIIGDIEEHKKDCVHPCVRYSEEPFLGYHWWMVYTPYYNANAMQENPVLCYGEGYDEPPTKWHIYKEIIPQPATGYNSDPNLLFYNGKLYLFWRENETPRLKAEGLIRGTYCIEIAEGDIRETCKHPLLSEQANFEDHEVSPTFFVSNGRFVAVANHLLFKNEKLQHLHGIVKKVVDTYYLAAGILFNKSQQKAYGMAVWQSDSLEKPFQYSHTAKYANCNLLYKPWHSDMFEYEGYLYAIVQSNQCSSDICLARWNENLTGLTFFKQPLVTNKSIKGVGIYKPTAIVCCDKLHVYVSAQAEDERGRNILYQGKISLTELKALSK